MNPTGPEFPQAPTVKADLVRLPYLASGLGKVLLKRRIRGARVRGVDAKAASKLTFEDALGRLESIVESMESGQVPLAELLAKFEEGNTLLKVCEGRLKDAELKIEQLAKQKNELTAFVGTEPARDV